MASPMGELRGLLYKGNPIQIQSGEHAGLNSLRLADWDGDGDIDVLMVDDARSLWFYERFPDDHFQAHELMKFPAGVRGFEVADWDSDLVDHLDFWGVVRLCVPVHVVYFERKESKRVPFSSESSELFPFHIALGR